MIRLDDLHPASDLRGLAARKAKADEFKSVRSALLARALESGWAIAKRNRATTRLRRPKSTHRLLEDRVWTLAYRMGFSFLSGAASGEEAWGIEPSPAVK